MPFEKQIRATLAGIDSGPYNIYHTSIAPGNLVASGVTRAQLLSGFTVMFPDGATLAVVESTGFCTNSASVPISPIDPTPTPTPTPTPNPTPVPTATPAPSPTPVPPTLTISYIKSPNLVTTSLSTPIGVDIVMSSVYADGYTSSLGGVAIASIADTVTRIIIPAGNTNYSFTPATRCGGSGTTCWNTATHYTVYNVIINSVSVSNGQTINIGGVDVIISFPPLRSL
jgi:hypothetical protein